jgi:L-aminopeptidase/D-esterase-like protein
MSGEIKIGFRSSGLGRDALAVSLALILTASLPARAQQNGLTPTVAHGPHELQFDWPAIEISSATYEVGPTGLTLFHFPHRVMAVVDVRGGGPGTVNTDMLRLGYAGVDVDSVVITGGSLMGEEAIAGAATGEKDLGMRSGNDMPVAVGAILFDLHEHRLNDIYPDKPLVLAALKSLRPGVFPLGSQGAGRMAMQGSLFDCAAHSGQGAAFRQIGDLKIAVFVVVNARGTPVDRQGRVVSCPGNPQWTPKTTISQFLVTGLDQTDTKVPTPGPTNNTTISLVVVNRRMEPSALQRLAVQVHTSMARAIQPFSTAEDGDTLFAVSTQEVGPAAGGLTDMGLDITAGEMMWDAILSSVPDNTKISLAPAVTPKNLARLTGSYRFGDNVVIDVWEQDGALMLRPRGEIWFFDLLDKPIRLTATSDSDFYVNSQYRTRLSFVVSQDGTVTGAVINPGGWALNGQRILDSRH